MTGFHFQMSFRDPINLTQVSTKLLPKMTGSKFNLVVTTPAMIVYGAENAGQIIFDPQHFVYGYDGKVEYSQIKDLIPDITTAFSVVLAQAEYQYFLASFQDVYESQGIGAFDTSVKYLMPESIKNLGVVCSGIGIRLFSIPMYENSQPDDFRFEPMLVDPQKWYIEGNYHCRYKQNEGIAKTIDATYNKFEGQKEQALALIGG
jgi:hypothetical protein